MKIDYKDISLNDFVKDLENKILIANDLYCDALQDNRKESAQEAAIEHDVLCTLSADIERIYLGDIS